MIEFVFMLTRDDVTVGNAAEVLASLRESGLRYVGFKDIGPPPETLAEVTRAAHEASMEVMLEVVSTSAEDELRSLHAALDIGVDWVLGGTRADVGVEILGGAVKYCPFPGTIEGHPSVLKGSIAEIAADAERLTALDGVHGVDLLAYRHPTEDPIALTRAVAAAASGHVIAAGSVTSFEQIAALGDAGAWGFTIGSAIFANQLPGGPSVPGQVAAVLAHIKGSGPFRFAEATA
ncbi:1-(5-phosphoribosyl)-5-((5-phosphoribosylamino)methylideneamino)imidazole-4-carboxamide isomerase [Solirubrobacter soli]|uniref:1-(5-phosphoribosyl)-5-((5- phosphoribosylamino)methylideneamino)imidazole-4- carboxamide isomerase n=1 Tax=Solirubrobacter soli TaxID=363832 RepID=UPI0003FAEF22|nr:1-(5-phosphoribosyl)-5-((5-phosphoribosylamino)methylideneamino)imidazole-4-carboxamide isomerase [Solirubrobacter soli]